MDGWPEERKEERGEEREERGERKYRENSVGEIVQGQIDKSLIPSFPARSADTSIYGSSDPTYSPFLPLLFLLFPVTLGTDRDSSPSLAPLLRQWVPPPPSLSLSPSTPSDVFAASPRST
jgi:hypothetical protein